MGCWQEQKKSTYIHTNRKKMFLLNVLEKHGIDCHGQERKQKPQTIITIHIHWKPKKCLYLIWYIGKFIIVTITIILYLFTLTSRFMFNNICKHTEERKRLVVLKLSRSGLSMFFRLYESSYEKKKKTKVYEDDAM